MICCGSGRDPLEWGPNGGGDPVVPLEEAEAMVANRFIYCHECSPKLQTTIFCRQCGQPFCSLDCFRKHAASHPRDARSPTLPHPAAVPGRHADSSAPAAAG